MSTHVIELDDAGLLGEYARTRESGVFEVFARRHVDWIYSAALQMTKEPAMAEDVTQGVLMAASQKAGEVARHPAIVSWLFRATRYGASVILRGERRRKRREEEAGRARERTGGEVEWMEIREMLDGAVAKLSGADREAILLRFYRQLSHGEVAVVMKVPEETVRKRVNRALGRLRAMMGVKGTEASLGAALTGAAMTAAPKHLAAMTAGARGAAVAKGIHSAFAMGTVKWAAVFVVAVMAPIAVVTGVVARRAPMREMHVAVAASLPAVSATEATVHVAGRDVDVTVVDAGGKGVAGARVAAYGLEKPGRWAA